MKPLVLIHDFRVVIFFLRIPAYNFDDLQMKKVKVRCLLEILNNVVDLILSRVKFNVKFHRGVGILSSMNDEIYYRAFNFES